MGLSGTQEAVIEEQLLECQRSLSSRVPRFFVVSPHVTLVPGVPPDSEPFEAGAQPHPSSWPHCRAWGKEALGEEELGHPFRNRSHPLQTWWWGHLLSV